MDPASWTCGVVRPNVIHFPRRDFVSLSHLAFSGLVSIGVGVWWELWNVGEVENLEDWDAQRRIEVWTILEGAIKDGMMIWRSILSERISCLSYHRLLLILFGLQSAIEKLWWSSAVIIFLSNNNTIFLHQHCADRKAH
jgi:hypothetical protein